MTEGRKSLVLILDVKRGAVSLAVLTMRREELVTETQTALKHAILTTHSPSYVALVSRKIRETFRES